MLAPAGANREEAVAGRLVPFPPRMLVKGGYLRAFAHLR